MTRRRRRAVAVVVSLAGLVLAAPGLAQLSPDLTIAVDRARISSDLGGKFSFESTITNDGQAAATDLIAHLNVLSLRDGTYVDPEDWSSDRTRYLGPIPAGGSVTTRWNMQAVNDGEFAIYVALLPASGEPVPPATAPAIRLDVASRRTLNPEGMVPIALGVPLVIGLLGLGVRLRRRG